MRKFKKFAATMLVGLMATTALAGCSKSNNAASGNTDGKEGSVLNIYVWNEEFKSRVTDHYPGYVKTDDSTGKIGDVTVKWHTTPNENNAYQNNLDEALLKQKDATADDKIDIFLVEADYALKYVDTDYTMPIKDLGITDSEIADQYKYTQDIVTDSKGVLKGLSWQGCPGVLIYNRDIAKEVLGTDDPAEVQKSVSDWSTFEKTAKTMKDSGYFMVSGFDDTFRVFSNNVSSPWVVDGKVVIDDNIMNWVSQTKTFTDNGYNNQSSLWDLVQIPLGHLHPHRLAVSHSQVKPLSVAAGGAVEPLIEEKLQHIGRVVLLPVILGKIEMDSFTVGFARVLTDALIWQDLPDGIPHRAAKLETPDLGEDSVILRCALGIACRPVSHGVVRDDHLHAVRVKIGEEGPDAHRAAVPKAPEDQDRDDAQEGQILADFSVHRRSFPCETAVSRLVFRFSSY